MAENPSRKIELQGVRVHNLKNIDLEIPHGQLVSVCGLSGSGKSSLAFDTLYAEGQRRYFESLSTWTRQYLEQLEKPDADRIDGIPPAIAIQAHRALTGGDRHRTTVGTASEVVAYLQLLFARIGKAYCPGCDQPIDRHNPDSIVKIIEQWAGGTRYQIAFQRTMADNPRERSEMLQQLRQEGFRRLIWQGKTRMLDELTSDQLTSDLMVVVDRLSAGADSERARESLETAFDWGAGTATLLYECRTGSEAISSLNIDGKSWVQQSFSRDLCCGKCGITLPTAHPHLFSFTHPAGACGQCAGFGTMQFLDMDLIVPDRSLSIEAGAIAPWNMPAYEHERHELLDLADDYDLAVDVPFEALSPAAVQRIWDGVPERKFGGLSGFFDWLERKKYKVQVAVFLNRWKSSRTCDLCQGQRLNREALAFRVGGQTIAQLGCLEIGQAARFIEELSLDRLQLNVAAQLISRIASRLQYLDQVGLGYLSLDRSVASLSSGESQRVMLTKALGSTLTGMLYVLDEPSAGLHPVNTSALVESIRGLNARGNTVVVVDHEENTIRAADRIVEIGPEAGAGGGQIVFDGCLTEMLDCADSVTRPFVQPQDIPPPADRRRQGRGTLKLTGASGRNLQQIDVAFPLNCLCLVTGVSGSGKSSLIQETLYPAIRQKKGNPLRDGLPFGDLFGWKQIDEVVMIDQNPPGRSSRSNPVTYVKAFDDIRKAFADTVDARTRNFKAGHFSFNVEGGRCEKCRGEGQLAIDMQFMTDIYVRCDACQGKRFRDEILDVRYRSRNIDDVLRMTVRQAFGFFRGQKKIQQRLKALIDVGLDYVQLGQPSNTLSSGESQRLKLAQYLNTRKQQRTLFLMDEPTYGLHMRDVIRLVDCFATLLAAGNSMIVVEHNLQLMRYADWIIDLGPGASRDGGQIVACGSPEHIAAAGESATGRCLREHFGSTFRTA